MAMADALSTGPGVRLILSRPRVGMCAWLRGDVTQFESWLSPAPGCQFKFNLDSPVSAALVAVVWVIDWLVSFTFARLGFLLAEEMKAELGQEIPCTQVFLVSPMHLPRGTTGGPGIFVSQGPLWCGSCGSFASREGWAG